MDDALFESKFAEKWSEFYPDSDGDELDMANGDSEHAWHYIGQGIFRIEYHTFQRRLPMIKRVMKSLSKSYTITTIVGHPNYECFFVNFESIASK